MLLGILTFEMRKAVVFLTIDFNVSTMQSTFLPEYLTKVHTLQKTNDL